MTRLRTFALALVGLAGATGAVLLDAHHQRGADRATVREAAVRVVGSADLALSSNARWLRHPTQAEPAAPFDLPTSLDTEPAGAAIGPPAPLYRGVRVRRAEGSR